MSSQERLEELVKPFLTVQSVVILPIANLSSMLLIHGMYIIIFGLCMHVLHHRRKSALGLYVVCTISLFVLANLFVAIQFYGQTRQAVIVFKAAKTRDYIPLAQYLQNDKWKNTWISISSFTTSLMNALADIMLVHRCYILWGSRQIPLCILSFMAIVLNGIALITASMITIGMCDGRKFGYLFSKGMDIDRGNTMAIAVFNGLLSLLTAGRIWWISREARQHIGAPAHAKYTTVVSAILESGVLYPTTLVASIVMALTLDPHSHGTVPINLGPIASLMSGLAPTLIIVRIAYGKSIDTVQQMVSIHFAEHVSQVAMPPSAVTRPATVDLMRSCPNNEDVEACTDSELPEEAKGHKGRLG